MFGLADIIQIQERIIYNHGQKPLGQSEHNFNFMRFTSSVAKSSAVFLQIHVPSPLPTQYNVERSKELCLDGFNTVCWGGGSGQGRTVLVARGYNFACVKKPSNCTTVPRLLSMIVDPRLLWFKFIPGLKITSFVSNSLFSYGEGRNFEDTRARSLGEKKRGGSSPLRVFPSVERSIKN